MVHILDALTRLEKRVRHSRIGWPRHARKPSVVEPEKHKHKHSTRNRLSGGISYGATEDVSAPHSTSQDHHLAEYPHSSHQIWHQGCSWSAVCASRRYPLVSTAGDDEARSPASQRTEAALLRPQHSRTWTTWTWILVQCRLPFLDDPANPGAMRSILQHIQRLIAAAQSGCFHERRGRSTFPRRLPKWRINAVLALLVFALGKVAIDGVFQRPISTTQGQPSGFRGGSVSEPPGLAMFNEALRWHGFVASLTSLENVQMLLLEATYYETHARHLQFWRCAVAASTACQVVIKGNKSLVASNVSYRRSW